MTFGRKFRLFTLASAVLCLGIAAGARRTCALDEGGSSTACVPPTFVDIIGPDYVAPLVARDFAFQAESETGSVWFWIYWGDGESVITPTIPSWSSITLSHAWRSLGTYQISVFAYNGCAGGGANYAAQNVVVTNNPPRTKNVLDDQRKKQIN